MADPVISLKILLHEMTDRSALARWPENTYTCKQFSSYDRSSHNRTDKRAWFEMCIRDRVKVKSGYVEMRLPLLRY